MGILLHLFIKQTNIILLHKETVKFLHKAAQFSETSVPFDTALDIELELSAPANNVVFFDCTKSSACPAPGGYF